VVSKLAHEMLDEHARLDEEEAKALTKAPAVLRGKSYQFIRGVDHGMQVSCGFGLIYFFLLFATGQSAAQQRAEERSLDQENPLPFRVLSISIDQGSVGWAAMWFLIYHVGLSICVVNDPSHRVYNDLCLAIKACNLWWVVVLTRVAFNMSYGPFDGGAWLAQAKSSVSELFKHLRRHDPLKHFFLNNIAGDHGLEDRLREDGMEEELLSRVQYSDAFRRKNEHCALARWMSWISCAVAYLPSWHSRLWVYLWWGLTHGWARKGAGGNPIVRPLTKRARNDADDDMVEQTMRERDESDESMWKRCKNTMHVVIHILADGHIFRLVRMIVTLSGPLRQWHGTQNVETRSFDSSAEFYAAAAAGGSWFTALLDTLKLLYSVDSLSYIGLRLTLDAYVLPFHTFLSGEKKYRSI
jgi:hypothetical protein